jgi:serine/threonine protein kinase/WD40 repeat protein
MVNAIEEMGMRDPFIGAYINRYEVREVVEKTDLFSLYKSYDSKLERTVLIKTIKNSAGYSDEAKNFFLAEAKTLARLTHDNIVKILDSGSHNGSLYLVSEYVSGNTLSDMMTNPIPWEHAVDILLPITDALLYAHTRGVIHRDLRPDAIFIDLDDQPKLSDFSLVKIIEEEETRDMTTTNLGLGSAGYISPEQGQGLTVDSRSDIYSLGVIFYEMVTGKKLFYADTSMEIVIQHIMKNPPRPRKIIPDLPKSVENIILKAISKEPDKRYQSMEELAAALKSIKQSATKNPTGISRQARIIMAASGLFLLLALAGLTLIRRSPDEIRDMDGSTSEPALATQPAVPETINSPLVETAAIQATVSIEIVVGSDPFSIYDLPSLPVLQSSPLPAVDEAITPVNATAIRELARWGQPKIHDFAFINHDQTLLASTTAGLYYLDPKDISARYFIDVESVPTAFTVSKDGEWVATGDRYGTVTIWNTRNGKKVFQLTEKAKSISALDFSPDNAKLVFSDADRNIHLWNPALGESYTFERRHGLAIHSLFFAPDGESIYSGSDDFQITVWDVNGLFREKFTTSQKINHIGLSPNNRYLAAAMNDSTIRIWDVKTGAIASEIKVNRLATDFTFVDFLPNSETIVTGSADGYVRLWNISGDEPLWEVGSAEVRRQITSLALSGNGAQIAVMFDDGIVEIWNLSSRQKDAFADWSYSPIRRVVISPDDRALAYQLNRDFVEIVTINNATRTTRLTGTLPQGSPISAENKLVIMPRNQADQLHLYSLPVSTTQEPMILHNYPGNGSVSFSPDSRILVAGSNRALSFWSISSGLELKASTSKVINQCQVIYGNSFVAAGSELGIIFFEDNLPFFCQFADNPNGITDTILPDGSMIVQALRNHLVEIREVEHSDQKFQAKTLSDSDTEAIAISKRGELLAVGSVSGAIEIYDLETMRLLRILELNTGPVHHLLFSNDGKYIIAGSSDGTLRFFGIKR